MKRHKRRLRALAIAKILFEQEGYHTQYLEEIEALLKGGRMPKLNIKDLPPEVRVQVKKRIGRKASATREQVLRVAALIMQAATASGEDIHTQRKAMELALKWLKTR